MRRRPLSSAVLIAVIALAGGAATAAAATVRVDDDGNASASSCNGTAATPKTVQAGITAAGKNGVVIVCPGTYKGRVRIDGTRDGITIQGAAGFTATILPPATGLGSNDPLIWVKNSADTVTLKGLVVSTAPSDCTVEELVRLQGRGLKVVGNRLTGGGCYAYGIKAFAAGGQTVSATIKNNTISKFFKAGISGSDELTTLTVTKNIIRLDLGFIPPSAVSVAGITMDSNVNGSVTGNTVGKGTGAELPFGIIASYGESLPITGNTISGTRTGIYLSFVQLMTVTGNSIYGSSSHGILTAAFTHSTVGSNVIGDSGIGILSSDNTFNPDGDNLFQTNVITNSTEVGCRDQVAPGGEDPLGDPPLTGNIWIGNTADSDDPDGICPPPAS